MSVKHYDHAHLFTLGLNENEESHNFIADIGALCMRSDS